ATQAALRWSRNSLLSNRVNGGAARGGALYCVRESLLALSFRPASLVFGRSTARHGSIRARRLAALPRNSDCAGRGVATHLKGAAAAAIQHEKPRRRPCLRRRRWTWPSLHTRASRSPDPPHPLP